LTFDLPFSNHPLQSGHLTILHKEFLFLAPFFPKEEKGAAQYNDPEHEEKKSEHNDNEQTNDEFRHRPSFLK